jgi:RNA polymerase sigma factor (TIGR02999 family)
MSTAPKPIAAPLTELLNRWRLGDSAAFDRVQDAIMRDLARMAEQRMAGESACTIAPTDLLNEALMREMRTDAMDANPPALWNNRAHFFATMSLHMRSVLVDHARRRQADKRGAQAVHVTLSLLEQRGQGGGQAEESMAFELIALDEALNSLAGADARSAEILHLTYFAGLVREEIAAVLEISIPTVDRELRFARAWLSRHMGHDIT